MINRFEWAKAVMHAVLPQRAKVLANALALKFANDETGQANPSFETLAEYLKCSPDTVKRAVIDLCKGGWLAREVGRGRGVNSGYVFLSPGSVVAFAAARNVESAGIKRAATSAKRGQDCGSRNVAKGGRTAAKRGQDCGSPYKDEQSSEQKTGARPAAHLAVLVERGGWKALEWNKWLSDKGLRTDLASLKALHVEGGYNLPFSTPPKTYQKTEELIALRVIEWARGAGDARAA